MFGIASLTTITDTQTGRSGARENGEHKRSKEIVRDSATVRITTLLILLGANIEPLMASYFVVFLLRRLWSVSVTLHMNLLYKSALFWIVWELGHNLSTPSALGKQRRESHGNWPYKMKSNKVRMIRLTGGHYGGRGWAHLDTLALPNTNMTTKAC